MRQLRIPEWDPGKPSFTPAKCPLNVLLDVIMMFLIVICLIVSVKAFMSTINRPDALLKKRARMSPLPRGPAVPFGSQRRALAAYAAKLDLDDLNPSQRAAVTAPLDQPVRVIAGPGSGKTRVLVRFPLPSPCFQTFASILYISHRH